VKVLDGDRENDKLEEGVTAGVFVSLTVGVVDFEILLVLL
jgi:hypothetical protein